MPGGVREDQVGRLLQCRLGAEEPLPCRGTAGAHADGAFFRDGLWFIACGDFASGMVVPSCC